ncbi:MAG TPA: hypothetical protein VIG33_12930 [Pseudobdellovibrionaceae bacterium]|jgi:hypothetical protein
MKNIFTVIGTVFLSFSAFASSGFNSADRLKAVAEATNQFLSKSVVSISLSSQPSPDFESYTVKFIGNTGKCYIATMHVLIYEVGGEYKISATPAKMPLIPCP